MKAKINCIEIRVTYDLQEQDFSIELTESTAVDVGFGFHILDKEQVRATGRPTVEFADVNDLEEILEDFKIRFKNIQINKNINI